MAHHRISVCVLGLQFSFGLNLDQICHSNGLDEHDPHHEGHQRCPLDQRGALSPGLHSDFEF